MIFPICKVSRMINSMMGEWEAFYNYPRPHAAMNGKTPYERLKEKLC